MSALGDDKVLTEAQLQIERLKKLKEEKDLKEKKIKTEAFRHVATPASIEKRKRKMALRDVRLDSRTHERLHSALKEIQKNVKSGATRDKVVNLIIARFLDLNIDYRKLRSKEDLKALIDKIKIES